MTLCTALLTSRYPGLSAAAWTATRAGDSTVELPALEKVATSDGRAGIHVANMSAFFRGLGTKGKSPVDFQIKKAAAGELEYSRRDPLIDYLLYVEVLTGFLIGLHDCDALSEDPRYGLAKEAAELSFEHIGGRTVELRPDEPVLLCGERIIASLRHGPDRATRVTDGTSEVWGVIFGSPQDQQGSLEAAVQLILREGVSRGIWTERRR